MQKHTASYNLACMDKNADIAGASSVLITDDRFLNVHLTTGPGCYAYTISYTGLLYGTGPRVGVTEAIERRAAMLELLELSADHAKIVFTGSRGYWRTTSGGIC